MIYRFPVSLDLFRSGEGWLVLILDNSISEVELVLDKPVNVPHNMVSTILSSSTRSLYSIVSLSFTRNELEYATVCVDDACFSASRCTYARRTAYGVPIRVEVQVKSNIVPLYELSRVMRPRVMALLCSSKASELRVRTNSDHQSALKLIKLRYEFPLVLSLPDVLTRDLAKAISDQVLVRNLEDYVLGLATEITVKQLKLSGVLSEEGLLTRLGQVLVLCLAPYMLPKEHVESLKNLLVRHSMKKERT